MKTLLAGISIALLAGTAAVQADAQSVKLTITNSADRNIQVDVYDVVTDKNDSTPEVTPGGTVVSNATIGDDGMLNFRFSILYRGDASTASYFRCWPVSTNPNGQSELTYSVDTGSGKDGRC